MIMRPPKGARDKIFFGHLAMWLTRRTNGPRDTLVQMTKIWPMKTYSDVSVANLQLISTYNVLFEIPPVDSSGRQGNPEVLAVRLHMIVPERPFVHAH